MAEPNSPNVDAERRAKLERLAREAEPPPPTDPAPSLEDLRQVRDTHDRMRIGGDPIITIVCAGLFLYVGFETSFVTPKEEPLVAFVGTVFPWLAKIVGFGLLVVALAEFRSLRFAAPLGCFLAALATLATLGAGLIWITNGYSDGWLYILFGLLNASATRSSFLAWKGDHA
ncbi:MAG: hypothetical protein HZB38_13405 [Planctomycetes bacterium]|nr:hypothetical protein [Planctomycetota bacterium]